MDRHPDRPAPGLRDHGVRQPAHHEVLILIAHWFAILEANAYHFVAGQLGPVPRAVEGDKRVAGVLGRELATFVEGHPEGCRVGCQQDVRHSGAFHQTNQLIVLRDTRIDIL